MNRPGTLRLGRHLLVAGAVAMWLAATMGCAVQSVGAYRREHLADPIMSFNKAAKKDARRIRTFEAREGSTGGSGGDGGGCACK